ncbi:MAG: ATP-binding protein, partial [Kofleriaceae bacterium]
MSSFSIRNRLLVGAVIGVAVTYLASALIVTFVVRRSLHAQFDLDLLAKARQLAEQVEQHRGELGIEIDPRTLGEAEAFQLWARGESVAKSRNLGDADLIAYAGIRAIVLPNGHSAHQVTWYAKARLEGRHQVPNIPIILALAAETGDIDASTHRVMVVMIGIGISGLVFCVVFLLVVVYRGMRPLAALAASIAAIRVDDLGVRLSPVTRAVELQPIVGRLDDLLARLGAAIERERELTSEVAHELRTPLTGLRTTLEVGLDRERSPERYREAMQRCLEITIETERMATSLLSLARLDAGQAKVVRSSIDLDELVRDSLAKFQLKLGQRRLELVTHLRPVTISSDLDKLKVVLANLFDNAASHATEGGTITVTLTDELLELRNTGVIDAGQIEHVFDRFWRGDPARAEGGHTGIGLALVAKLLALLGGSIVVAVEGGEFVARVRWTGQDLAGKTSS